MRGRKKKQYQPIPPPNFDEVQETTRQFNRLYKNDDGTASVWVYNLDIFPNGPISVEIFYPKNYKHVYQDDEVDESNLPISKRTFIHPINGKTITYSRMYKLVQEGLAVWP